MVRRTMISQLQSVGEGALGKLAQSPVTHKAVEGAIQVKDRVEKLVRGLEAMDERVSKLEARIADLEKAKAPAHTAAKTTAKTSTAAAKKPVARKPAAPK
jgi:hypothetical protein